LRNVAVALGNALAVAAPAERRPLQVALQARLDHPSVLVREHVQWALQPLP
jgi:epoxyqueuosine reductase